MLLLYVQGIPLLASQEKQGDNFSFLFNLLYLYLIVSNFLGYAVVSKPLRIHFIPYYYVPFYSIPFRSMK